MEAFEESGMLEEQDEVDAASRAVLTLSIILFDKIMSLTSFEASCFPWLVLL